MKGSIPQKQRSGTASETAGGCPVIAALVVLSGRLQPGRLNNLNSYEEVK